MTPAAIGLLASLLALEGATEPVRLVPFQCGDVSDGDVRGPLRVELRGQLLEAQAPTPSAVAIVAATCAESELLLSLAIPGRPSPQVRRVALGTLRPDTRARSVALAIAELLRRAPPADDDDEDDDAEKPAAPPPVPSPLFGPPRNTSVHLVGRWLNVPHDIDAFVFGVGWGETMREQWFVRQDFSLGTLTNVNEMNRDDPGFSLETQVGRSYSFYKKQRLVLSWAPVGAVELGSFREENAPTGSAETTTVIGPAAGASFFIDRDDPCDGSAPRHGSIAAFQLLYVHWFGDVADHPIGWRGWGFTANFSVGLAY